ncbi:MAG: D-alanine--D-alanine ligase [Candidatus Cloacimonetes bacterium]|nr:D-alanine--D-alanine ligase [Candidatus Cloacimonadota bacterium]
MYNKIVLLQGGVSAEREVSLETCDSIKKALNNLGKVVVSVDPKDFFQNNQIDYKAILNKIVNANCDIVFIGLHGGDGEDGTFQKLFEIFNIEYTGSSSYASFISMNKKLSKLLVQNLQIPIPKFYSFHRNEEVLKNYEKFVEKLHLPFVVKPNSSGSSIGVSFVENREQFHNAVNSALNSDDYFLVEQYIIGREITVAMMGNHPLPVVEIKPKKGWYDYQHKYTKGHTIYEVPAMLSQEESERVSNYATKIFNELQCKDYVRIDFRFDGKDFYFLEVNTLPGMTNLSLVPMAAKAVGISFDKLINRIINRNWEY